MGYKRLFKQPRSGFCVLDYMDGFEDDYKLFKGYKLTGAWPDDVTFSMDQDFKKLIKLSDQLENQQHLVIGSKALCEFLKAEKVKNIEFLPVTILNHKGRVASKDYCIVNPVTTQDCVDVAKSGITWNNIIKEDITKADNLTFDESKIAEDATFFRVKGIVNATFVRDDLAKKIAGAGFTGITFREVNGKG